LGFNKVNPKDSSDVKIDFDDDDFLGLVLKLAGGFNCPYVKCLIISMNFVLQATVEKLS